MEHLKEKVLSWLKPWSEMSVPEEQKWLLSAWFNSDEGFLSLLKKCMKEKWDKINGDETELKNDVEHILDGIYNRIKIEKQDMNINTLPVNHTKADSKMEKTKSGNSLNRRKFVTTSFLSALGAMLPKKVLSAKTGDEKSKVVIVEDEDATSGTTIDSDVAQSMVDTAILSLTGYEDVGEAWKSLMPGITTSSVIAIKVNCRAELLPTHPEVSYAVCNGLSRMIIDGENYPENNIHIYDNEKAYLSETDYDVNTSSAGVQCYMATEYSSQSYTIEGYSQKVCTLLHDTADFLINIAVLKNHASMAGATMCLKNHFGSINSPRSFHINHGDPYIGALNAIDPIKNKSVLNILDALLGAAEGGPYSGPTFVANKIIMSADPVAVDTLGRDILIEQESSTVDDATYIDSAADYGIGTNDPDMMDISYINNNSTTAIEEEIAEEGIYLKDCYPNPFAEYTTFEFVLDKQVDVSLEIYSAAGVKILTILKDNLQPGEYNYTWKGDNGCGVAVQSGMYIANFLAGDYKKALVMYRK